MLIFSHIVLCASSSKLQLYLSSYLEQFGLELSWVWFWPICCQTFIKSHFGHVHVQRSEVLLLYLLIHAVLQIWWYVMTRYVEFHCYYLQTNKIWK